MSKIIQFKGQEEEQHSCPTCDLAFEYVEICKQTESEEELFEVLSQLIHEGIEMGVANYLKQEIVHKAELLDELLYGNECCDCDECCNCEDED